MNKEEKAIARIHAAYEIAKNSDKTLVVAYSGGKDSDILLHLAFKSDVPFTVEHNHTTADAPQTVYHIREVFRQLTARGIQNKINYPPEITIDSKTTRATMWNVIIKNGIPPTRLARYCCRYFKERHFEGQYILTGIRWDESNNRKKRGLYENITKNKDKRIIFMDENDDKRKLTEMCVKQNRLTINPIIDWTDKEVWTYITENGIKINPLYEMGFHRVGCIGCPMAGKARLKEFEMFPKYKQAYIKAFDKMLQEHKEKGKERYSWKCGLDVFDWWVENKNIKGQLNLFESEE